MTQRFRHVHRGIVSALFQETQAVSKSTRPQVSRTLREVVWLHPPKCVDVQCPCTGQLWAQSSEFAQKEKSNMFALQKVHAGTLHAVAEAWDGHLQFWSKCLVTCGAYRAWLIETVPAFTTARNDSKDKLLQTINARKMSEAQMW